MANCRRTRKHMAAYICGELGARRSLMVERHLESCPECSREYRFEKMTWGVLSTVASRVSGTDPGLSWHEVRSAAGLEAGASAGRERWTAFTASASMRASRAIAETIYWGKLAAIPAAGAAAAIFIYSALHIPSSPSPCAPPGASRSNIVVRVNFGPGDVRLSNDFHTDGGDVFGSHRTDQSGLKYGWKKG